MVAVTVFRFFRYYMDVNNWRLSLALVSQSFNLAAISFLPHPFWIKGARSKEEQPFRMWDHMDGSVMVFEVEVESFTAHRSAISVKSKIRSGSNDVPKERGV